MAPKYVLEYFNLQARGELARLLLHQAGVEFEDIEHKLGPDWVNIKNDVKRFPLGQVPTLAVDGKVICQSQAINRYLANEFGLYGENNEQKVIIDQVTETIQEFVEDYYKLYFNKSLGEEEKKKSIDEYYSSEAVKKRLTFIEDILKENGTGYFVGTKVSIADLALVAVNGAFHEHLLDDYPNLKGLNERVKESDNIKKYLANRTIPFLP